MKTKLGQGLIKALKETVNAKPKKPQTLKTWLIPRLRRLSYQWPNRNAAKSLARVERGKYKCNICQNIFGPKDIFMDHVNPIIPVDIGFTNIGTFVESLFCEIENYQALCENCHSIKTQKENQQRKDNK